MRFDFQSTEIDLTINGVDCTLDVGDAEMQDRLLEAAALIQAHELSGEKPHADLSFQLREIVKAVLGEEVTAQVYTGVRPNYYKDVQLVLFLRQQMDEAEPTQSFESTMGALNGLLGVDD